MTRIALAALASVLACLIAGCSTLTVKSDWDQQADFTRYRTYKILPIQSQASPLVENRILDAVRVHLQEREFAEDDVNPDMIIAAHVDAQDRVDVQTYNYGYPHAGYPYWHGGRDVSVTKYQEGTLIIDIVDAETSQLVWRGWGTKIIDESAREAEEIQEIVDKILAQYPPD